MLCDFARELSDLLPLRMASRCVEGSEVAQRFLALADLDTASVQGFPIMTSGEMKLHSRSWWPEEGSY
jgi:hypothetical protein